MRIIWYWLIPYIYHESQSAHIRLCSLFFDPIVKTQLVNHNLDSENTARLPLIMHTVSLNKLFVYFDICNPRIVLACKLN